MAKLTMDSSVVAELSALCFSNAASGCASMLREMKLDQTMTAQEKTTVRNVLSYVADIMDATAKKKKEELPADSPAPMLLDVAAQHAAKARALDLKNQNQPHKGSVSGNTSMQNRGRGVSQSA